MFIHGYGDNLVTGIFKKQYWQAATISNIVFMGGLAAGRLISFIIDGIPSVTLVIGFFGETLLAIPRLF
ncbi:MAG: DUF4345 family protein [Bacteroidota bacterium]